jgi:hypothetical protein
MQRGNEHRHSRSSDANANEAVAIPKHVTTDDGRVIDCIDWSVRVPLEGLIEVTVTGYVRTDSLPSERNKE